MDAPKYFFKHFFGTQDSTAAYGFGVFKWKEHSTVDLLLEGR